MTNNTDQVRTLIGEMTEYLDQQVDPELDVIAKWRDRLEAALASAPTSAPVRVDFAAVASVLRRALRDGTHYGYRRDFILQQALALEALSQQPAAVDTAMVERPAAGGQQ